MNPIAMRSIQIEDLGIVLTGSTPPTKERKFYGSEYLFLKPTDIESGVRFVTKTEWGLSHEGAKLLERIRIPAYSTCVVTIGSLGKLCMTNEVCYTNQAINTVIPNQDEYDTFFVYYLMHTIIPKLKKLDSGTASGRENVKKSAFESIQIQVPILDVQRKIATVLRHYDDLLENNRRRIRILEEMARIIYRDWFVHFRFPGYEVVEMVDSELGEIPKGWNAVKLSEVSEINRANIDSKNPPPQIAYVNISSVSPGQIDEIEYTGIQDAPSRAKRIVQNGDTIWSTVRPNRKSYCLILNPVENMIVSTGFAVISPKKVPFSYIYHTLTTDDFTAYLTNHATGSAYPAVSTKDFENAIVLLPSNQILNSFHNTVEKMHYLRSNLIAQNGILQEMRNILLPKLVSGEIDVSELEIDIPLSDTHKTSKYRNAQSELTEWLDGDEENGSRK